MEVKFVDLYRYSVSYNIDNEVSISKEKYNAIPEKHNYVIYKEKVLLGFTPIKYLDIMRKNGYYFYSLRGDYTSDEIFEKYTPLINEELEYYKTVVKDLEKVLASCLYYIEDKD